MAPSHAHCALAQLARVQGGVFTSVQARACGYGSTAITNRVQRGQWRRVHASVLAASTSEVGALGQQWTALLLAGPRAVLSHGTAAQLWGIEVPDGLLELTTSATRTPQVPGALVRRRPLPLADLRELNATPLTSRSRTIVDCLQTLPMEQARRFLDRVLQRRLISGAELRQRRHEVRHRAGAKQLAALLIELDPAVHSDGERRLVRAVRAAGLTGWKANYRVRLGSTSAVVDLAFMAARVAVEVDGRAWHTDVARFQHDRTRQNALHLAGWIVLRFTWDDVAHRPEYVIETIRAAIGAQDGS